MGSMGVGAAAQWHQPCAPVERSACCALTAAMLPRRALAAGPHSRAATFAHLTTTKGLAHEWVPPCQMAIIADVGHPSSQVVLPLMPACMR